MARLGSRRKSGVFRGRTSSTSELRLVVPFVHPRKARLIIICRDATAAVEKFRWLIEQKRLSPWTRDVENARKKCVYPHYSPSSNPQLLWLIHD